MERAPTRRRRALRAFRLLRALEWRRALFVLPNLFTLSSVFCGFFAIVLSAHDPTPKRLYQAALAIFFGVFFDMADGRVARLTRTQSAFGVQLDSLADVITFGVAPATIVYASSLRSLGMVGILVAFVYISCGAMRLARFNVLAASMPHASRFFVGLPIPVAAGLMASLVMVHQEFGLRTSRHTAITVGVMTTLAFLMVSNIRYRTFKDIRPGGKVLGAIASLVLAFTSLAALVHPAFALLVLFGTYATVGLLEEVVFFRRRRQENLAPAAPLLHTDLAPERKDSPR
jgi:CDP-diacylglycerol---serine O-phosphatidyltransferase